MRCRHDASDCGLLQAYELCVCGWCRGQGGGVLAAVVLRWAGAGQSAADAGVTAAGGTAGTSRAGGTAAAAGCAATGSPVTTQTPTVDAT